MTTETGSSRMRVVSARYHLRVAVLADDSQSTDRVDDPTENVLVSGQRRRCMQVCTSAGVRECASCG
jgi:hypothetical protein